jgi:hypothetical protein
VNVRFFKSFNYDYLRKSDTRITELPWERTAEDQLYPYVTVPLERDITTVVGGNESGKSQLLLALKCALTGSGIRRGDFCRYSTLFAVDKGMRHPDFGLTVRELADAGSYDHGSALGFNLTDAKRTLELDRDGVPTFCGKAMAHRFDRESDGRLTLVELAHSALTRSSPSARSHWLTAVEAATEAALVSAVDRVPDLSDPVRRFTHALLTTNRRRLLDER